MDGVAIETETPKVPSIMGPPAAKATAKSAVDTITTTAASDITPKQTSAEIDVEVNDSQSVVESIEAAPLIECPAVVRSETSESSPGDEGIESTAAKGSGSPPN
eukprot:CAMPEP_0181067804 /NCGR_PEP_ID=MMETSP1070-20121207/26073_1 /TAXON_ID=265543 /ORGANISM="Minutocellus polymorphus, Strain NH13" /LENGTH=103 /DNA_ID=CAMNT_0023148497 /DNA_START=1026 /DNA_END=1337 /DNA_ORIENTATION=-